MADTSPAEEPGFAALLVEFGHELRRAGLPVGTGDIVTFEQAAALLDPADVLDLYWAGRTTLVSRRAHVGVYHRVFREFFLGVPGEVDDSRREVIRSVADAAVLQLPDTEPGDDGDDDHEVSLGHMASNADVWREKSFADCSAEELAAVRRIIATLRLTPPRRRTRRYRPTRSGARIDARRMAREAMRTHGEPTELARRDRTRRVRPLVLVLDVSGSMADYSRNLLQFAYSATRAADRVEVFCFGTRLTRITPALARRKPDDAMRDAAGLVLDWDGGTRIGDSLDEFVRRWGRRGTSRGAIVVVCSDGLDRGDPAVLASAMERLARLSHRVVWMNPHRGDAATFRPSTMGMIVAAPHVDALVSGHNLRSLESFAAMLPDLR